jgi:branched-chain amino acid transport system ATP-binding protein
VSTSEPAGANPGTVTDPGTGTAAGTVLRTRGLSRRFGGLLAVTGVDLDLTAGRLLGVIGPNGAGKSTLINLITGHLKPTSGTVEVDGRDLTGARPWRVAHAGVARTFQIVKPFRGMTVVDNVVVAVLHERGARRRLGAARATAMQVLDRVGLAARADASPAELSVADARRLELAKALALRPRALLLDEVLAGLRPAEIEPALELIDRLRRDGLALLMVEHLVRAIAAVSDEILVLHHGEVLTRGPADRVLADSRVVEAYLGSRYATRHQATGVPRPRAGGESGAGRPAGSAAPDEPGSAPDERGSGAPDERGSGPPDEAGGTA